MSEVSVIKSQDNSQARIYISGETAAFTRGELINQGFSEDSIYYRDVQVEPSVEAFIDNIAGNRLAGMYQTYLNPYTHQPIYSRTAYLDESNPTHPRLYYGSGNSDDCMITFTYSEGYVPTKTPFNTILCQGDKGVFFKSKSLRPDILGFSDTESKPKYFFVDNRCRDSVCPGLATVSRVIFEQKGYGFVAAEMVKMSIPPEHEIMHKLRTAQFDVASAVLYFKKHPLIGEYIYVSQTGLGTYNHVLYNDGESAKYLTLGNYSDADKEYFSAETVRTVSAAEFVCSVKYGKELSTIVDAEVLPRFVAPGESERVIPENTCVRAAVDAGWVDIFQFGGYAYAIFRNSRLMSAIFALDEDTILSALAECNRMNEEFDASIARKVKKGKLSVDAVVTG